MFISPQEKCFCAAWLDNDTLLMKVLQQEDFRRDCLWSACRGAVAGGHLYLLQFLEDVAADESRTDCIDYWKLGLLAAANGRVEIIFYLAETEHLIDCCSVLQKAFEMREYTILSQFRAFCGHEATRDLLVMQSALEEYAQDRELLIYALFVTDFEETPPTVLLVHREWDRLVCAAKEFWKMLQSSTPPPNDKAEAEEAETEAKKKPGPAKKADGYNSDPEFDISNLLVAGKKKKSKKGWRRRRQGK